MRRISRIGSTRWGVVAAALAALALLAGAVGAGARTPATAALSRLPKSGDLDYSASTPGRLTPLSPSFVAQSLGLDLSTIAPGATPTTSSNSEAGATNPVQTATYACVNGHQTADPLSPPCVASFSGDNGGATYQGVSRD